MDIYSSEGKKQPSVEILLNSKELGILVNALQEFKARCEQYKSENEGEKDLGMAHVHYQDYDKDSKGKYELVFYIDFDKEQ